MKAVHAGDLKRDFGHEAAILLDVIGSYPISMTEIKKRVASQLRHRLKRDAAFWLEMVSILVEEGLVRQQSRKSE